MPDLIGQRLGQYEVIARLGEGGMATVYRARQASMKRDVAIKVIESKLARNAEFIMRFEREAQTVAALNHPHILKVFDYGQHDEETIYLVMELMPGGSLANRIRQGPLPLDLTATLLDQIARALDYAHEQGIIHRDLKPQNVLLDSKDNAVLTDFGIAKLLTETTSMTQSGTIMGTPGYMSPEQWRGKTIDARSDNYALGIMLFEMLTGSMPFKADTPFAMMHAHIYEQPPSVHDHRSELSPAIEQVLLKAIAKDPAQRYQSAVAMCEDFRAALGGTLRPFPSIPLSPNTPPSIPSTFVNTPPASSVRNNRPFLLGGAVLFAILVLFGAFVLLPGLSGTPSTPTQTQITNPTPTQQAVALAMTASAVPGVVPPPTMVTVAVPTNTQTPIATNTPFPSGISTRTATSTQVPSTITPPKLSTTTSIPATHNPDDLDAAAATYFANLDTATANAIASYTRTSTSTPTATVTFTPTANKTRTLAMVIQMTSAARTVIAGGTQTANAIASSMITPTPTKTSTATSTYTRTYTASPTLTFSPTAIITARFQAFPTQRAQTQAAQVVGNQTATTTHWTLTPPATFTKTITLTFTPTYAPSLTNTPTLNIDPPTPDSTAVPTSTPTFIATATPTLAIEEIAARQDAQETSTYSSILTETSTNWTITPTSTLTLTIDFNASAIVFRTQRAATAQAAQTETATQSTATPTLTGRFTLTSTPTSTNTPTITPTLLRAGTPVAPTLYARISFMDVSFVYVPQGCFLMGSTNRQIQDAFALAKQLEGGGVQLDSFKVETPQHEVCITQGFYIGESPVTNAQFTAYEHATGKNRASVLDSCKLASNDDTQPVVCVSWEEANAFAIWMGCRLPTEAQWEYAARGPASLIFPWGNRFDKLLANTREGNVGKTTPINRYQQGKSWVGAQDMAGNVWQWLADWYDGSYYTNRPKPDYDPTGPESGSTRLLRGGSWYDFRFSVRTAYRLSRDPKFRSTGDVGFRVVCPAHAP